MLTDGYTLGMNGAKISVFEKRNEIRFNGLLESADGGRLKAQIGFEVLRNFTYETLEREFANEELGRFLVATNLTESDSSCQTRQ